MQGQVCWCFFFIAIPTIIIFVNIIGTLMNKDSVVVGGKLVN